MSGLSVKKRHRSRPPGAVHLHDAAKLARWEDNAYRLLDASRHGPSIVRTCFVVLRFLHLNGWYGACHASTAVLHVLLHAQGIPSVPCMGEARIAHHLFDHSWLEIGGTPFDMAITLPLPQGTKPVPPVVCGLDMETGGPTAVEYGIRSGFPADPPTVLIQSVPFVEYIDGFPGVAHGLWGIVAGLAGPCGLAPLRVPPTRAAHADTRWTLR